jgi:hypothetical protein
MAISPGSHKAGWSPGAFLTLGQNCSEDGGKTRKEIGQAMAENVNKRYPTCELYDFVLILGESDHALNLHFSALVCQDS